MAKMALFNPCMKFEILGGQMPSFEVLWKCHSVILSKICLTVYICITHHELKRKSALWYNMGWNPFWSSSLIFIHICFDEIFSEFEEMHDDADADSWIDKKLLIRNKITAFCDRPYICKINALQVFALSKIQVFTVFQFPFGIQQL